MPGTRAEARVLVYEENDVGPFVLNGFAELRSLWGGWAWCNPVYDANARCLRVYDTYGNTAPVAQAGQLLVRLRRELLERTLDLVLQTGTIEATFGAGLSVHTLTRPSTGTLQQVVETDYGDAASKAGSLAFDFAAIESRMHAGKAVPPEPQFAVNVTNTVPAGWSGAPCYVWVCLGLRGQQAVVRWAQRQQPPLRIEVVGPGNTEHTDKLACLLPTGTQARAFADEYNVHKNQTRSSRVQFGFDDPASADLLVKHAGAEVTMYKQVDLDEVNATSDPLGTARLIAAEAAKKYSVNSFTIDEPSDGVAVCRLFARGCGGATQCSKAFVYASEKWQAHRLLANGRFPRLLLQTLLKTGRLQQLAKAAGVRVAEPKNGTELPPYLGVKGSDTGFGQLLYHLGVEQDALKQRAAMCSITPALATELRRVGWVEEQQWYDAHVVVDDDNVFVAASSSGTRDQIVASLNQHRTSFGLSTTDAVTCVCGALSANRLTSCGHVVCDDCMVKKAPHCPYAGCQQLLYVDDLVCNGEQRKDLAERLICAALDKDDTAHAFGVCPTATCAAIIPLRSKMTLCTKCAVSVCTACKVSDVRHKGRTCAAYAKYLTKVAPCPHPDCDANDLPFKEGSQRCPQCSTSVCVACGLLDADLKGHHTSCKEYSKTRSCPMLRLYKEARQFASKHLTENGYSTFEFHENECVRNPGCGALDKFLLAARENNVTGVLEGRLGHFGWHGTKSIDAVHTICCDGWDPTRRAVQAYGKGEYFAYRAATALGGYAGDTKMLIVAFILKGSWLNRTEHFVVNNPRDHRVSYVVPVGVVWFGTGGCPKQICARLKDSVLGAPLWEWQDVDGTWKAYADAHCRTIEQVNRHKGRQGTVQIHILQLGTSAPTTYEIDFATMKQTNLSSGLSGVRSVRRTDRSSAVPLRSASTASLPAAAVAPSSAVPKQIPARQQGTPSQPLAAGQSVLYARAAPPPAAPAPAPASAAAVVMPSQAVPMQQTAWQGAQASKPPTALWEWQDDDSTWKAYADADCRTIEQARKHKGQQGTVQIRVLRHGMFVPTAYKIDFATMKQTNLSSGLSGVRSVRRTAVPSLAAPSTALPLRATLSGVASPPASSNAAQRAAIAVPTSAMPSNVASFSAAPSSAAPSGTLPSSAVPSSIAVPTSAATSGATLSSAAPSSTVPTSVAPSNVAPSSATPPRARLSGAVPSSAVPPSIAVPTSAATSAPSSAAPSRAVSGAVSPLRAAPSIAVPTSAVPSNVASSSAAPSGALPSSAVPSSIAVPTSAAPSISAPSSAAPSSTSSAVPTSAATSNVASSSATQSSAAPSGSVQSSAVPPLRAALSISVPTSAATSGATPSSAAPSSTVPPPSAVPTGRSNAASSSVTSPSAAPSGTLPSSAVPLSIAVPPSAATSTSAPSSAAPSSTVPPSTAVPTSAATSNVASSSTTSSTVPELLAALSIAVPTSAAPSISAPSAAPSSAAPSGTLPSSAVPLSVAVPTSAAPSNGASYSVTPPRAALSGAVPPSASPPARPSSVAPPSVPAGAEQRETLPSSAAPPRAAPNAAPFSAAPPSAAPSISVSSSAAPSGAAPSAVPFSAAPARAVVEFRYGYGLRYFRMQEEKSRRQAMAQALAERWTTFPSLAAQAKAAQQETLPSSEAPSCPVPSSDAPPSAAQSTPPASVPSPSSEARSASLPAAPPIASPSAASSPAPAVPELSAALLRAAESLLSSLAAPSLAAAAPSSEEAQRAESSAAPPPAAAASPASEEALSAASLRAAQSILSSSAAPSPAVPSSEAKLSAASLRAAQSILSSHAAAPSSAAAAVPLPSSEATLGAASLRAAQRILVPRKAAARAVPSSAVPPSATSLRVVPSRTWRIFVEPRAVPSPISAHTTASSGAA